MRLLSEVLLVLLFFVVYQLDGQQWQIASFSYRFDGIYSATLFLMLGTAIQSLAVLLTTRRFDGRSLWLLTAVLLFGGMTLMIRNPLFIQWKPSIVNWGFALAFWTVARFSPRGITERMFAGAITMPPPAWQQLNRYWILYFLGVGILNLVVAYTVSLDLWMYYKLYSFFIFIPMIMIINWFVIKPYVGAQGAP